MEKFDIIFWIFFLIALALLIWMIFGKSPSVEGLIATILASEFALWRLMYKHGRELTTIKNSFGLIRNSFRLVRRDIDSTREDINSVKTGVNLVKKDLGLIKKKLKIKG